MQYGQFLLKLCPFNIHTCHSFKGYFSHKTREISRLYNITIFVDNHNHDNYVKSTDFKLLLSIYNSLEFITVRLCSLAISGTSPWQVSYFSHWANKWFDFKSEYLGDDISIWHSKFGPKIIINIFKCLMSIILKGDFAIINYYLNEMVNQRIILSANTFSMWHNFCGVQILTS